jgi:hypothetical protein
MQGIRVLMLLIIGILTLIKVILDLRGDNVCDGVMKVTLVMTDLKIKIC